MIAPGPRHVGALLLAVAAVAAFALAGCSSGSDGADTGARAATTTTVTTVPIATAAQLAEVDLSPGLLTANDFPSPDEVEPILLGGDFSAVSEGQRIQICGQDIRAQLGPTIGRISQFRVDRYAVTQTVTAMPDPEATVLGQRFGALAGSCTTPWAQPDPNGGLVTRRVLGGLPIPDLGTNAAAILVRGRNELGRDDTVLLVAINGPYVSSLAVTGPVGDRFPIVRPLELALAERLRALPRPGAGS